MSYPHFHSPYYYYYFYIYIFFLGSGMREKPGWRAMEDL